MLKADTSYYESGFERPELGGLGATTRMSDYIARRKVDERLGLACRGDRFCNGAIVAFGLCGGHLRHAVKAGSIKL